MREDLRTLVFWGVCLPVRVTFAIGIDVVLSVYPRSTPFVMVVLFAAATGFTRNAIVGRDVGFFSGRAWWHRARGVHAALFALSAALCAVYPSAVKVVLLSDVLVGALLALCLSALPQICG